MMAKNIKEKLMIVKFEINLEIDKKDFEKLKKLEHHADWLLDLDSWNEIKSISDCKVTKFEKDNKSK